MNATPESAGRPPGDPEQLAREQLGRVLGTLRRAYGDATAPTITCPRCAMVSPDPDDIAAGYCGNCHDWTSPPLLRGGSSAGGLMQLADPAWAESQHEPPPPAEQLAAALQYIRARYAPPTEAEQIADELRPTLALVLGAMVRAFGPAVQDEGGGGGLVSRCRWCGEELQRGVAEEAAQWRTKPGGRYFCPHSADSLHHHGPELDERGVFAPCHCLCSALHPTAPGICLAAEARAHLLIAGRRVPVCRPCADAALGDPAEEVPSGR